LSEEREASFDPSKILAPVDGSENAHRSLSSAVDIAKKFGAELIILNVIPPPSIRTEAEETSLSGETSYYDQQEDYSKHFVDDALSIAAKRGLFNARSEIERAEKSVVETILDIADRENADLIVIGTRRLGSFKHLVQESVSSGVIEQANCDVLVVR
jgi:nucleotide-binding universal stress UspA family protein